MIVVVVWVLEAVVVEMVRMTIIVIIAQINQPMI
jgi:hypothetical protein